MVLVAIVVLDAARVWWNTLRPGGFTPDAIPIPVEPGPQPAPGGATLRAVRGFVRGFAGLTPLAPQRRRGARSARAARGRSERAAASLTTNEAIESLCMVSRYSRRFASRFANRRLGWSATGRCVSRPAVEGGSCCTGRPGCVSRR